MFDVSFGHTLQRCAVPNSEVRAQGALCHADLALIPHLGDNPRLGWSQT